MNCWGHRCLALRASHWHAPRGKEGPKPTLSPLLCLSCTESNTFRRLACPKFYLLGCHYVKSLQRHYPSLLLGGARHSQA